MLCVYGGGVIPGQRAGSGSGDGKYNAESSKQDSKRFNSITKTFTIHFAQTTYIIYLWQQLIIVHGIVTIVSVQYHAER